MTSDEEGEEYPDYVLGAPHAIIVDLDGTLAIMGDRSPYDAAKCEEDELDLIVSRVVDAWVSSNEHECMVILVTGRQELHRSQTENWLEDNGVFFDKLFMRQTDDGRNDAIIKREIYDDKIKGKYNIDLVLDDRSRVVNMWRSAGLKCFQVSDSPD